MVTVKRDPLLKDIVTKVTGKRDLLLKDTVTMVMVKHYSLLEDSPGINLHHHVTKDFVGVHLVSSLRLEDIGTILLPVSYWLHPLGAGLQTQETTW